MQASCSLSLLSCSLFTLSLFLSSMSPVMLFGTFQSQFSQIWLFLKWFGTENCEIYLLFGSKFWKFLFTVWLLKIWELVNKLRNLALFIWEFSSKALPGPNITDVYTVMYDSFVISFLSNLGAYKD